MTISSPGDMPQALMTLLSSISILHKRKNPTQRKSSNSVKYRHGSKPRWLDCKGRLSNRVWQRSLQQQQKPKEIERQY